MTQAREDAQAVAKFVRISPRKARLVTDNIRGRSVFSMNPNFGSPFRLVRFDMYLQDDQALRMFRIRKRAQNSIVAPGQII